MKTNKAVMLLAVFTLPALGAELAPCFKNHFILDEPCAPSATQAAIGKPTGIAVDSKGDVYFSSQSIVFMVNGQGALQVVAGNGKPGYSGDGGSASDATLSFPDDYPEIVLDPFDFWEFAAGLAFDSSGNLYISDSYNDAIRKVSANDGTISTFATNTTQPGFWWPQGLALDASDNLYVAGQYGSLVRIRQNGETDPIMRQIYTTIGEGIALDRDGSVLIADGLCRIWRTGRDRFPEVAVQGAHCPAYEVVPYSADSLSWPFGVALDLNGDILVADTYNHCIRRFDSMRRLTTVAGTCGYENHGFSGDDGPATAARLNAPFGIAVDSLGNIFVSDTYNYRVRRIAPDGTITTIAGNGGSLKSTTSD